MNKRLFLIFIGTILLVSLAGCNLPGQQATPDLTQVGTYVQQTIAAMASATPEISQQTEAPAIDATASVTPENVFISPIVPTQTFTATPEPTATLTPTPTIAPENPKAALGNPVYVDPLDTGGNFGLENKPYKDEVSEFYIDRGVMVMKSYALNNFHSWRLTYPRPRNFYLEAPITTQTCSGADAYGFFFLTPDYGSGLGFYYGVTCDGQYYLFKRDKTAVTRLIEPIATDKLRAGAGQTNLLGVWVKDQTIRLYANDAFVAEINNAGIEGEGHFGVFVAGRSGAFSATMAEIKYWDVR